jgi:hypothetical protein
MRKPRPATVSGGKRVFDGEVGRSGDGDADHFNLRVLRR